MSVFRNYTSTEVEVNDNKFKIDLNTRFFLKMNKKQFINFPGVGFLSIGEICDDKEEEWTECYINEDEFLINFNDNPYKIKLTACDQTFGSETFYYSDFISLIKEGYILIKENEFQCPIEYRLVKNIPNSCATIVEEGTVVVDIREYI